MIFSAPLLRRGYLYARDHYALALQPHNITGIIIDRQYRL
jgi:hypothetical protein